MDLNKYFVRSGTKRTFTVFQHSGDFVDYGCFFLLYLLLYISSVLIVIVCHCLLLFVIINFFIFCIDCIECFFHCEDIVVGWCLLLSGNRDSSQQWYYYGRGISCFVLQFFGFFKRLNSYFAKLNFVWHTHFCSIQNTPLGLL